MTGAWRAQLVLGGVALVVGTGGLIVARDLSFTSARGEIMLGLGVSFNPLGALVTLLLAALAVAGAMFGLRSIVMVAAAGFGAGAVQVVLQFGRADNWLGSRGSNLSLWLALAIGLAVLAWLQGQEEPG